MKLNSPPSITKQTSIYGCISFVFRRILCSRRALPTHPFDHFNEIEPKSEPNLVARLMGLDSMPEKSEKRSPPLITRSKSVNLEDCRVEETGEHRRVRSSVSYKESQCYFELEDDEFFVIRFESGRRKRKSRVKKKKKEKCLVEKKVETESGESANLSPVSVLDHTLFIGDHEELHNREEEEICDDSHGKWSKEEDDKKEANEPIQASLQRQDYHSHQNIEMLKLICRLAGSEMANSEWDCKRGKMKMWEVEIGSELGLQILDHLLDELLNQPFCLC